jgi:type IV pilus assembly protein PilP
MKRSKLFRLLVLLLLSACGGEKYEDLTQFVNESDNLPRGRIEPLPEVKPYEPVAYNAFDMSDPFRPRKMEQAKSGGGIAPDMNRRREALEAYPLDNLRMVGTLEQGRIIFALVKTPDNTLHRVKPGSYLGQNFGFITQVTDSSITLKEVVQDGTDDWTERVSTLQLLEEDQKK